MSKKPQPQKENPKNKPQIVDQQNEPFLKTLQKKVRNINKKLTEIAELQVKENLKPEQVEKVNRKGALLQERSRVQETATLFKQTYAENAAVYRGLQLRQLEILARALGIFHSGAKLPESDKLASLWHAIEQGDKTFANVNESIAALSQILKDFANDKKLQKALTSYVEEHGNDKIVAIVSNQEKIVNDILEEKVEVKPEPVKEVKEEVVIPVVESPVIPVSEPQTKVQAPLAVAEKVQQTPKVIVQEHPTPLSEPAPQIAKEEKPATQQKQREYKKRDNYNRGGRGDYKGNRPRKEGEQYRERRQYKPKYAEKQAEQQQPKREEESDSSDSEPEVRNFRKQEIRQLQDDGFIVVGKPKPKTRDVREQREAHDRQHGKKHHHHQHQQNQPKVPQQK